MTSPSSETVLQFQGVTHRYGKTLALEAVNCEIRRGEHLCVIGPNGGGKSTLLKLVLGLIEPTEGRLAVLGQPPKQACSKVGYVPQSMRFDPLFPISSIEIVLMGRLDHVRFGNYSKECRNLAREALDHVGLADVAEKAYSQLSGGQRQRVLIARALATSPEILLLDEPTANIDLSVEEKFLDILRDLREAVTILLVTHDLDVVSTLGDSVLCVNRRVHRHSLPLQAETVAEIFRGGYRVEHDRETRHIQGDHSACQHD
ncbi:MAG: ABC transporter ATP-binding protein [Verrucomicrobiota bacterium]